MSSLSILRQEHRFSSQTPLLEHETVVIEAQEVLISSIHSAEYEQSQVELVMSAAASMNNCTHLIHP